MYCSCLSHIHPYIDTYPTLYAYQTLVVSTATRKRNVKNKKMHNITQRKTQRMSTCTEHSTHSRSNTSCHCNNNNTQGTVAAQFVRRCLDERLAFVYCAIILVICSRLLSFFVFLFIVVVVVVYVFVFCIECNCN